MVDEMRGAILVLGEYDGSTCLSPRGGPPTCRCNRVGRCLTEIGTLKVRVTGRRRADGVLRPLHAYEVEEVVSKWNASSGSGCGYNDMGVFSASWCYDV